MWIEPKEGPPRSGPLVVALAFDRLPLFEFGIVVELFGLPRPELDDWYRFEVAAIDPPPLRATGGVAVEASIDLAAIEQAHTILIPGWRDVDEAPPGELLARLVRAHEAGARIASVCSGAFVLAAAGLLDGRRATTHWLYADRLARRFPRIDVDADVLYIDEGRVLTSAGSAAGIDLGLHLVRQDFGAQVANRVSRRLIVPPHREGGQSQFVETAAAAGSADFGALLDGLRRRLHEPLSLRDMAAALGSSPRTLARQFRRAVGTTPHRWLTRERTLLAQELLESSELGVEEIATRCGFGSAQLLRHHFRRQLGVAPTHYRRTFSQVEARSPAG